MGRLLRPDGHKMRALRLQKGWPREQLAQIAGVSVRKIRRVEGGGNASFETLRAIAGAFGLEVHELMRGTARGADRCSAPTDYLLRLLSAETLAAVVTWCMPYAPAAKGLMATFAMIVVAASAVALSPLLVDREEDAIIVDSSQSLSPVQIPSPARAAEMTTARQARPTAEARATLSRTPRPERSVPTVNSDAPPIQPQPSTYTAAQGDTHPMDHPAGPSPASHAVQAGTMQTVIGVIHTDWLKKLAQPVSTRVDSFAQVRSKTAPESPGYSNRGTGGGYSILGRPFVRSGKSTAAFFTKVGSSIKRAF